MKMKNKNKIIKKKPMWLHECNLFFVNGCSMYCEKYVPGVPYSSCKHRKILCMIISNDLDKV